MTKVDYKNIQLSKKALNLIKTTGRNNVELINIADNKANILLSLNGIMLTVLIPLLFSYRDIIIQEFLFIPLVILASTLLITIIICSTVLRPAHKSNAQKRITEDFSTSPFMFSNYGSMKSEDYIPFVQESLKNKEKLSEYILEDHFYVGKNLGRKYVLMKNAFQIFVIGVTLSLLTTFLVLSFL